MTRARPVKLLPVLAALLLLSPLAPVPRLAADDFGFHEPSARAASLGGAFTARADDTSALFYNPAGLAFLPSLRFKTNVTLGGRSISAVVPDGGRSYTSAPYEILGGHALSWQPIRRVTVAAGLFPVATFSSVWNPAWSGRTASVHADLYAGSFRTAVAVEVVKDFAVSAGLDVLKMDLAWHHKILFNFVNEPLPEPYVVESRLSLEGRATGFVAGALWKIVPAVQVGASYRGSTGIDLAGSDIFAFSSTGQIIPGPGGASVSLYELLRRFFKHQDVTGRATLPREIVCGVALTPFPWLAVYADVQWTRWSEFGEWSFRSVNADDELAPDFSQVYQDFYGVAPDYGTQSIPFAFADTRNIKAGLEYRAGRYIAVRAGYARTMSSVAAADRSPVYPDLDRDIYTLGFGYEGPVFSIWRNSERIADLSFDAFARYATAGPQASSYPGFEMTYSSKRFTWGVGVGFSF